VVGQWPGGFQGDVKVTAGPAAITGWKVTWTFANGQTISQSWGSALLASGSAVTVTNVAWNGSLGAGASTNLGFIGSWNNSTNGIPSVTCTAS
jgi:mannan endo-1,4-beta-mannosidase